MGDIDFIIHTRRLIRSGNTLIGNGTLKACTYLLAMVDYLSWENNLPLYREYNDIRTLKLAEPLFPLSVVMADAVMKNSRWKTDSIRDAIPEFRRFNIIEGDVRNVF